MKFLKNVGKSREPVSIWREIVPVGIQHLESSVVSRDMLPGEIVLTEDMGGEIADLIRKTLHKAYSCIGAPSEHFEEVGQWYGYPHPGGLSDQNGMKWWAYQKCTISNYKTAWWKVFRTIARIVEVTH